MRLSIKVSNSIFDCTSLTDKKQARQPKKIERKDFFVRKPEKSGFIYAIHLIFLGFTQRKNIVSADFSWNRSIKFGIDTFLKGSWVSKGQSPLFAPETDIHAFSQLKNVPIPVVPRSGTQKIIKKTKEACNSIANGITGSFQRGALSCRAPLSCETIPRIVSQFTPRRAHCV